MPSSAPQSMPAVASAVGVPSEAGDSSSCSGSSSCSRDTSNDDSRRKVDASVGKLSDARLHQQELELQLELERQRAAITAEHHRQLMVAQQQHRAVEEELAVRQIQELRVQLEDQRLAPLTKPHPPTQGLEASVALERDARQLLAGLRAEKDMQWQEKCEELTKMYTAAAAERDTALAERNHLDRQLKDAHSREASTRCVIVRTMTRRANRRLLETSMQLLWSQVIAARLLRGAVARRTSRVKSFSFWGLYWASQRGKALHRLHERCKRRFLRTCWQVWFSLSRRESAQRHNEDWHTRMVALHETVVGELVRKRLREVLESRFWGWRRETTLNRLLLRYLVRTAMARINQTMWEWRAQVGRRKRHKSAILQCLRLRQIRVLKQWHDMAATRNSIRQIGGVIAQSRTRRAQINSLNHWKTVRLQQQQHRHKYDVIVCRVFKLNLRRCFSRFVVSAHTSRRLSVILFRAKTRRHKRTQTQAFDVWVHAAVRARMSSHRHWKGRELHALGLDRAALAGGMFQGGKASVIEKALAQKARIESLTAASMPIPPTEAPASSSYGTIDRLEEERHARVAILQSEHRIILEQLRAGKLAPEIAIDSLVDTTVSKLQAAAGVHESLSC